MTLKLCLGGKPYTRAVTVYIPAGLDRATPAPFIVVNDGGSYLETMVPVLDALLAEKRLPHNLVAIFADSGGSSYGP
jgi:enterochelin esterase-like enzyme